MTRTVVAPDGTKSETDYHKGNLPPCRTCSNTRGSWGFANILSGMTLEERNYASNGLILRKTKNRWEKTEFNVPNGGEKAEWHPRVTKVETISYDLQGNSVSSTTTSEYAGDLTAKNNPLYVKLTKYYGYTISQGSLGSLLRIVEAKQIENDPDIPQPSKDMYENAHIRGLQTARIVKNSNGVIVSQSELKYDEAGLGNGFRGQPTTARKWLNTTNTWIENKTNYNSFGNALERTDANGNTTKTTFDSIHNVFPVKVNSAVPDPSGNNGSSLSFESTNVFDVSTGLTISSTDINNQTTTWEYNDPLLRPTKIIPPNGGAIIETDYGSGISTATRYVKTRKQLNGSEWSELTNWYDGLGRKNKIQRKHSDGDIYVETAYDSMNRTVLVSDLYRLGDAKVWTSTVYDEGGRVKELILPDGTITSNSYGIANTGTELGPYVTSTDQNGNKKRSITNVFSKLVRLDEMNSNGQLGSIDNPSQATYYNYDSLSKLTKITQGLQKRYFLYNSIGQLIRTRQSEQNTNPLISMSGNPWNSDWSVAYSYDQNGNLVEVTDAKNIVITTEYDALNRMTKKSYSDSTPQVEYKYDDVNVPFAIGKLTSMSNSNSISRTTAFNEIGKPLSHEQIVDGQSYPTTYKYALNGAVIEQSYPSGKVIMNNLNTNEEIVSITGKTNNQTRTYANGFSYNTNQDTKTIRYGNGRWESTKFNSRNQITEIGLGSSSANTGLLKIEYEYGDLLTNGLVDSSKNNGNIAKQSISFDGLTDSFIQTYKYDQLERLVEANETVSSNLTWSQTFAYDRYGNRTNFNQNIDGQQLVLNVINHPSIDQNTNRFQMGQGYTYDNNGNLVGDAEGRTFIFNGDNKQIEAKDSNGASLGTYYYDGEGLRVKKNNQ